VRSIFFSLIFFFFFVAAIAQSGLAQDPHPGMDSQGGDMQGMDMPGMKHSPDHSMSMQPQSLIELIEQHSTAGTDA